MAFGRRVKKAPYFRLYCNWWQDARIIGLSQDAREIWLRSIGYSKGDRLDGFLPDSSLLLLFPGVFGVPSSIVEELVGAGLWIAKDGGWHIHEWAEYQTTAAEDDARAESTRERKRRQRERDRNQPELPLDDEGDAA